MSSALNKKIFVSLLVLGSLIAGNIVVLSHSSAAAKPVVLNKVMGKAKFILQGTVTTVTADSLTLHVVNTSKNAKLFDDKDQVISAGKKTKITKNGNTIALKNVKKGDTVKVFGIFDKKSGAITLVRWIKVVQK